ncbi:MAG: hypothetical protein FGF50_11460 [Candidatus Brockarchaeota archaeon]|nr:hypothetical protein [Candidatus Brockarchaeota archaeon]
MARCAYRGNRIREIEEEWIGENVKDEWEKARRKMFLDDILEGMGNRADCGREAVSEKGFCMFHDPEYWKSNESEVREKFLELLRGGGEKFFVGFHLPAMELPRVVEGDYTWSLRKSTNI